MLVVDFWWWMWVCIGDGYGFVLMVGLFDLVDVWCWMSGVGCGFGMWVCLVWWMVCADLSRCFFFFFFFLGGVGGCAAVVVGGRRCCCGSGCSWPLLPHGGWAGVGDEDDNNSDRDREEEIYYFIM